MMDLKKDDHISICQDEEEPDNWYIFKTDQSGFKVRTGYDKKGCLFNHSKMRDALVSHFQLDESITHNFLIAGQPTLIKGDKLKTEYWGIIVTPK